MEEEKNENLKKNSLLSKQNNLEKIIKLDQKNSSQSLFTKAHRRRLLIRDQALSTTFSWTPNPTEQSLYAFWSHLNQYYYKPLKEDDLERVDLLMQGTALDDKNEPPKYTGIESYETFKDIISSEYKKMYQDENLSRQNYENLRTKYCLSTFKLGKSIKNLKPSTTPPSFSYDVAALKSAKSKGKLKGFLQEETKQLENFKNKIENKNDKKSDFLDEEIEKFTEEFRKVCKDNVKNLVNLKHRAEKKEHILDMNEIIESSRTRTPIKDKWSSSGRKSKDKGPLKGGNSIENIKSVFVQYLKGVVIKLENQQAAESIKYVVDCKKPVTGGEQYKFCVIFDEALRSTESWLEEAVLDKLDKLREQSLFKVYKIPQKIYHSVNSNNLAGFYYCDQKVNDKTLSLKDKPWKDLIKKGFMEGTKGFSKEELFLKSKEFSICHHCKYLFPEEFLVKCTYRSTDLKLPQSNSEYMNSLAYNGNIPKRSIWNNKRTAASFYQKRNGDNVCLRAYCRLCLKQNFDAQMVESAHKPNWICPFCTGICNCTRCLRYDTLNKLMSLFSILGGDLDLIKKESYSEKYLYGTGVEVPLDKAYKKTSYYALKPTRGAKSATKEVKGKLDLYKGNLERYQALKELRIKLERMRILCSQVARRERMKIRLDSLKNKILEEYVEKAKSISDGKNGKRIKPDFDFADLEPFKIKKVKLSQAALKLIQDGLTPVKRKRGRPRKDASSILLSDLEELSALSLEKKGKRGRKKKEVAGTNADKSYIRRTTSLTSDRTEERKMVVKIPTRKRGRPRKSEQEKKLAKLLREREKEEKRMRKLRQRGGGGEGDGLYEPEDVEEEEDEEDFEEDADQGLSWSEAGSEEGSEEDEEGENDLESGEEMEEEEKIQPVKRKVGRPRKDSVPKPRPRGRPPKIKKEEIKRPRGRPRLYPRKESSEDEEDENDYEDENEDEDESGDEEREEDSEDEELEESGSEGDEEDEDEEQDNMEEDSDVDEDEEEEDEDEEDEESGYRLPRELQRILSHQNSNQFNVYRNTASAGRVTRSLYQKKKRGRPRKSINRK